MTLCYWQRFDGRGGMLAVDMNASDEFLSNKPVENIFWPEGSSPIGNFVVKVHHYRMRAAGTVPVTVVVKADGQERLFKVNCVRGQGHQEVFRFQRPGPRKREDVPARQTLTAPVGLE